MSTSTWGKFLNLTQLENLLDVPAAELQGVLHWSARHGCSAGDHDLFLATFGIVRDEFKKERCWHLHGCGHLYTLGEDICMRLLSTQPQPEFW